MIFFVVGFLCFVGLVTVLVGLACGIYSAAGWFGRFLGERRARVQASEHAEAEYHRLRRENEIDGLRSTLGAERERRERLQKSNRELEARCRQLEAQEHLEYGGRVDGFDLSNPPRPGEYLKHSTEPAPSIVDGLGDVLPPESRVP